MSLNLDISSISVLIASASVVAGAIYYMLETKHQRVVRQTEIILRLSPWFNTSTKEIQDAISQVCAAEYADYKDYMEKYSGTSTYASLKMLGNFFEGIGLLVYRRLVETDIIYDFWGSIALSTWTENESLIRDMRKESGEPAMFEYWEYLAGEMRKRRKNKVKI